MTYHVYVVDNGKKVWRHVSKSPRAAFLAVCAFIRAGKSAGFVTRNDEE